MLALALGLPRGEMLARMTSAELSEWMAFYAVEPFGEGRADVRAGIVASTIANVNRNPKRRKKPFAVKDFIPQFGQRRTTNETLLDKMKFIAAAFGSDNGNNREPDN